MSGVKGRSGRQPRWHENNLEDATNLTFAQAYRLLKDENVPLIDRVRTCLPLAMKRIPDKHELVSLSLSLSEADARKALELAERNLLLRQQLQVNRGQSAQYIETIDPIDYPDDRDSLTVGSSS
jgi:hypothetical protein